MSNGKDKKKSNSPGMYKEWISEEGGEEDIFAKRDKYRKSFWKTSPNVKVRNKGLAGAEVTKKGGAYAYYRKNSKAAQEWNKAFAAAKAAGKKTFTWDGRSYTTEWEFTAAEKPEKKKLYKKLLKKKVPKTAKKKVAKKLLKKKTTKTLARRPTLPR